MTSVVVRGEAGAFGVDENDGEGPVPLDWRGEGIVVEVGVPAVIGPRLGKFGPAEAVGKAEAPKALTASSLLGAKENFIDWPERGR